MEGYLFWPASLLGAILEADGSAIDRRTQGSMARHRISARSYLMAVVVSIVMKVEPSLTAHNGGILACDGEVIGRALLRRWHLY